MKIVESVKEFIKKRLNELNTQIYEELIWDIENSTTKSDVPIESPVEQLFLIELKLREWQARRRFEFDLEPQHSDKSTGKYRIDFFINLQIDAYFTFGNEIDLDDFNKIDFPKLGIEIDSHIWHEKTKEQAQYDKERERFLVSNGWKIIRFTGREVYKNPEKAVDETFEIINKVRKEYFDRITKAISDKK